jgi:hypothetical protein
LPGCEDTGYRPEDVLVEGDGWRRYAVKAVLAALVGAVFGAMFALLFKIEVFGVRLDLEHAWWVVKHLAGEGK